MKKYIFKKNKKFRRITRKFFEKKKRTCRQFRVKWLSSGNFCFINCKLFFFFFRSLLFRSTNGTAWVYMFLNVELKMIYYCDATYEYLELSFLSGLKLFEKSHEFWSFKGEMFRREKKHRESCKKTLCKSWIHTV